MLEVDSQPPQPHADGAPTAPTAADWEFQQRILPGVSRTFAITIPELPAGIVDVVATGYLLCRMADTIEDEPNLPQADKPALHAGFAAVVAGTAPAEPFAAELHGRLTDETLAAERELVAEMARVIRITRSYEPRPRAALERCVRIMCDGMGRFPDGRHGRGLRTTDELQSYCYYVAGVVGEMLTELFCHHSSEIDQHRERLEQLTISFGQGLQLVNILKDIWDDRSRGFCWLPRELFDAHGFDLDTLDPAADAPAFRAGLGELIAIAHGNLEDALDYTLLIPRDEVGIRHFCLRALSLAVLTLRKIEKHRDFTSTQQVKIKRNSVKAALFASNMATKNDRLLRWLFRFFARPLPAPRTHRAKQ